MGSIISEPTQTTRHGRSLWVGECCVMTEFEWTINEQECIVSVTHYRPEIPMCVTGSGWGDCDPPEPEEFEFELLHPNGAPWTELHGWLTDGDEVRVFNHYMENNDWEPDYD